MPLYQQNGRGQKVEIPAGASDRDILQLAVIYKMVSRQILRALEKKEVYLEKDAERIEVFDARDAGGMPVLSLEKVGATANPPKGRGRMLVGQNLIKIVADKEIFEARGKSMGKIWGEADGSLLLAGLFARAPKGAVREIWYVDVAKSKAEGLKSPARPWRHVFKERIALVKAKGGLLMKAKGKRLWEVR